MAEAAVRHTRSKYTSNVEFSAEDASRSDWAFLARVVRTGHRGRGDDHQHPGHGRLCPALQEFAELIKYLLENVESSHRVVFSVHCHNDLGLAVANTLAALKAGARQAEVTLSRHRRAGRQRGSGRGGHGPEDRRKELYQLTTGIKSEQLFPSCRLLSRSSVSPYPPYKPIIGANAFAHESGIHQDGMLKNRLTYEIMTPESVGKEGRRWSWASIRADAALGASSKTWATPWTRSSWAGVFAVKELADRKKEQIFDEDVEALVLEKVYRKHDKYRLNT
jgi:2-isopropylmalate synthase